MMKWIANISINRRLIAWIAHMSINRRLLLASAIVAIIPGLVISVLGVVYLQVLNAHGQAVQVSTDAVNIATKQLADMEHMNADLIALHSQNFVANSTGTQGNDINQLKQSLSSEITTLQATCKQTLARYRQDYLLTTSGNMQSVRGWTSANGSDQTFSDVEADQQGTLGRVDQEWHAYVQAQGQVLAALNSNQPDTYPLLVAANNKYAPLDKDWSHMVTLAETVSDGVAQVDVTHKVYLTVFGSAAFFVILVVVVLIGYIVHLTIARPLRELVKITERVSKGDINARVAIKGNDEIYLVAGSMNKMMDNIVQLIQETQSQRDTLQGQIESLVAEVRGIGRGNLRAQAKVVPDRLVAVPSNGSRKDINSRRIPTGKIYTPNPNESSGNALGAVAMFFNDMVEELSGLVIRVKMASREVEVSATATLAMLAQLVQTSNVQSREIAEAMVEVGQMANSSRQVAERTRKLSEVVHDAQSAIEKGRLSVRQVIDGMRNIHADVHETSLKVQNLSKHSNNIKDIFTVISTIAEQMKVLALDAAAQASLVGENGKGFTVVASDIQRLAERTAGQVNSIVQVVQGVHEDIISATSSMRDTEQKSARGARLAWESGESLETIFAAVEYQAQEMDIINQVTMQQLQSFNAIENLMRSIHQSTQQMNENTVEASQNLEHLVRRIEELRNSVETFKLRQASPTLGAPLNVDPFTPLPTGISQSLAHFNPVKLFPNP